ncbi:MAG: winged helix-turn-helix transcriptional regulator [Rickettsiales bacterium]|nr:winged helix-turn-helix transcriptional regulator [Rickettsiales bacterium]
MKEKKQLKRKKALQMLAALAQDSRLDIFLLLMENRDKGGLAAGVISETLDIPPTTMSFHLSQLKTAGLIKSTKQGRSIIYRASKGRANLLASFLTQKGDKKKTAKSKNKKGSTAENPAEIPAAEKFAL